MGEGFAAQEFTLAFFQVSQSLFYVFGGKDTKKKTNRQAIR